MALVGSSRGGNAIRLVPEERRRRSGREPRRAVRHAQQGHRQFRHSPAGRQRVQRRLHFPQGAQRRAGRSHPRRRDDGDPLRHQRQVLAARWPLRRRARQAHGRGLRFLRAARRQERHPRRPRPSRGGVQQAGLRRHVRVHHRQAARQPVHHPGAAAGAERQGDRRLRRRRLHQPRGGRRRGRDLRGRRQDRRAQDHQRRRIAR